MARFPGAQIVDVRDKGATDAGPATGVAAATGPVEAVPEEPEDEG